MAGPRHTFQSTVHVEDHLQYIMFCHTVIRESRSTPQQDDEVRDLTAQTLYWKYTQVRCRSPLYNPSPVRRRWHLHQCTKQGLPGQRGEWFWGGAFERAFIGIRVFDPFIPSNHHSNILHEKLKRHHYMQRIREIKHSSITCLVFFLSEMIGPTAIVFYKYLASCLVE